MQDKTLSELVAAARASDSAAWHEIVSRYERLVWFVVREYRLDDASSADVSQTVWMRLIEHLDRIRDPEGVPAWLCRTARNEALRVSRSLKRTVPSDFEYDLEDSSATPVDAALLEDELLATVLDAFQTLDESCQQLLRLLTVVPPLDYDTISEIIGCKKGSIGPTRGRCLDKLRRILRGIGELPDDTKGPA